MFLDIHTHSPSKNPPVGGFLIGGGKTEIREYPRKLYLLELENFLV
jgi:hypothetical protein